MKDKMYSDSNIEEVVWFGLVELSEIFTIFINIH